jgi:biotin operon repressor
MATKKGEMLSAGKIAAQLGVTSGQVKKAIQEAGIEPTSVKNGCSYYDDACVKKIQKAIK